MPGVWEGLGGRGRTGSGMGCLPWGTAGLDGGTAVAQLQRIAVDVVAQGYD